MVRSFLAAVLVVHASALKVKDHEEVSKPKNQALKEKGSSEVVLSNYQTIKVAAEYQSGRSQTERAGMSRFRMMSGPSSADPNGFSWEHYRWNLDNPGLRNHPAKVKDAQDAKFVVTCCLDEKTKAHFLKLPKRSPESPYLIKILDAKGGVKEVFDKRPDFYALNYDLRDGMDKESEPVRGITIAPHNYYNGKKLSIDAPRKFFVAFQGRKTSKLRHELHNAFNNHPTYSDWRNISVETVMDRKWNVQQQTGDHKFNQKMNATYALLPAGDDRWSLRFSEALGAGAIPVIIADGLTLPYENIIDWSKASIRLPNDYGKDADKIMNALPSDPQAIRKLREAVYDVNRKYFATPEARADALLLDATALVKKDGKYSPLAASQRKVAALAELSQSPLIPDEHTGIADNPLNEPWKHYGGETSGMYGASLGQHPQHLKHSHQLAGAVDGYGSSMNAITVAEIDPNDPNPELEFGSKVGFASDPDLPLPPLIAPSMLEGIRQGNAVGKGLPAVDLPMVFSPGITFSLPENDGGEAKEEEGGGGGGGPEAGGK